MIQPSGALELREARLAARLSARDLAERLDVHPSTVLRWERGERRPPPAAVRDLAARLDVDRARLTRSLLPVTTPAAASQDGRPGRGLRALRHRAGVGATELAQALGVATHTIYNWEAGRARVPERHLPALAKLLGHDDVEQLAARMRHAPPPPPSPVPSTPLEALRSARGWSQARTARVLGVSRSTLRAWERGTGVAPWSALRRLASALGAPLAVVARAAGRELPSELDPRRWTPGSLPVVLATLREWSGLSQAQLADRIGCSTDAVRGWEAARHVPSPQMRRRLETTLRLPALSLDRTAP